MKKLFKTYLTVWIIVFVLFQIICFATPSKVGQFHKFNSTFWITYAFVTFAFIGQLICASRALEADSPQKLFYNIPILRISYIGLILMLIAGSAAVAIPNLPSWVTIVICTVVLAFTAIAVIKAGAAVDIVEQQDERIQEKTSRMSELRAKAALCLQHSGDPESKKMLQRLAEDFRYADPMSSNATAQIEEEMAAALAELDKACREKNDEKTAQLCKTITEQLKERNLLCKAGK